MIYALVFLLSLASISASALKQAVCIVPVADVLIKPIDENQLDSNTERAYAHIPISWGRKAEDITVCPRGHQILFNEIVTVIEESGPEVQIELSNILYEKPFDLEPRTRYWTLKKNLLPLEELSPEIQKTFLPAPLSRKKQAAKQTSQVITLRMPFYDGTTNKTYSAGTRFAVSAFAPGFVSVYVLDSITKEISLTQIPEALCYINTLREPEQKIKDFISTLQLWANNTNGSIPLVWGGSSFTHFATDTNFYEKLRTVESGNTYGYWERPAEIEYPFAGFDVSGLIYRAAQLCELPFYYRNTHTAAKYMRSLARSEKIAAGDLIKVVGGMFVVSNVEKNTLITALSYSGNYGIILETTLDKLLRDIKSYDELVNAYHTNKSLQTLRTDGSPWNVIDQFTILKLSSIWELSV
jgi:hypothetical protein